MRRRRRISRATSTPPAIIAVRFGSWRAFSTTGRAACSTVPMACCTGSGADALALPYVAAALPASPAPGAAPEL